MPSKEANDPLDKATSVWGTISKMSSRLVGYNRQTPGHESLDAAEETVEPDSPVKFLNKEALKEIPKPSTASPKPKTKRVGSAQELRAKRRTRKGKIAAAAESSPVNRVVQSSPSVGPRTRKVAAQLSPAKEIVQNLSRAAKRPRDVEAEDAQAPKSPKTRKLAMAAESSDVGAAGLVLPLLDVELPLDPGRRRHSERVAKPSDEPVSDVRQLLEAARDSPTAKQSGSEYNSMTRANTANGPDKSSHQPIVRISTPRAGKLRRPTAIREAAKLTPNNRGEGTFDFEASESPEQPRKLPPVKENTPQKRAAKTRQAAKTGNTRVIPAAVREDDAEDDGFKEVTPKKRGRPKRGVGEGNVQGDSAKSSTRATRSGRQSLKEPPTTGLKKPTKSIISRKSAPALIETPEAVDDDREDENEMENVTDDGQEACVDGQDDEYYTEGTTQTLSKRNAKKKKNNPILLGQDEAWEKILEGARKNGGGDDEESANGNTHGQTKHLTKNIQDLSKEIKKARRNYEGLIKGKSNKNAEQEENDQLINTIDNIESQIKNIKEFDIDEHERPITRSQAEETIQDIYQRGVPDMVSLLSTAMACRSSDSLPIYDLKAIQEIIRLQDMTVRLCRRAVEWTAKPYNPDKPIIKNIKSKVFPYLRDNVRKAFDKEMQRLWIAERKQQNRKKTQAHLVQSLEYAQEEAELEAERRSESLRQMEEDIRQTQEDFRAKILGLSPLARERRSVSMQPRYPSHQPDHYGALWTRDEERELIIQLQKRHSRNLPAAERYLQILNAPLLQNKLPEHIGKKALELKQFLMEVLDEADFIHSIA